MRRYVIALLAILGACGPVPAFAAITASITEVVKINRNDEGDCPAPCAVEVMSYDTTDTRNVREFHSLLYHWDYGDPTSGTWDRPWQSGLSKDEDYGPVAGHVYEDPGTYTITLTVRNSAGDQGVDTAVVTVVDPDLHWAGSDTLCVANESGTPVAGSDGCPSGALTVRSSDFNSAVQNADGKRTLFRCGDSFSGESGTLAVNPALANGSRIGTYGGDCSLVNRARIDVDNADSQTSSGSWIRIETPGTTSGQTGPSALGGGWDFVGHLQVVGDNVDVSGDGPFFTIDNYPTNGPATPQSKRVFLYNVEAIDHDTCIFTHGNSGSRYIEEFAVVDTSCEGTGDGHTHYTNESRTMYLGYHYDGTAGNATSGWRGQHARFWTMRHSKLDQESAAGNNNYIFQQRSCHFSTTNETWGCNDDPNQYVNIADNVFRVGDGGTTIRWCQELQCSVRGSDGNYWGDNEDVIFERNYVAFERDLATNQHMKVGGGDFTIRNNVFDLEGADGSDGRDIITHECFDEGNPVNCDNVHFLNNTLYAPGSSFANITFLGGAGTSIEGASNSGHRVDSNFLWTPNFSGTVDWSAGSGITAVNNLADANEDFSSSNPFKAALPASNSRVITDFELASSGRVSSGQDPVDAGTSYAALTDRGVLLDLARRCRPDVDAELWDVGAHELNGADACLGDGEPPPTGGGGGGSGGGGTGGGWSMLEPSEDVNGNALRTLREMEVARSAGVLDVPDLVVPTSLAGGQLVAGIDLAAGLDPLEWCGMDISAVPFWRNDAGRSDQGAPVSFEMPDCPAEAACFDGLDNDRDGDTDCEDPDCATLPACQPEARPVPGVLFRP